MFFLYILRSTVDGKFYIGVTNDLRRRIREHNRGESFSTMVRRPFVLVYYEAYRNRDDAATREKFFKTGWGRQYIQRALKNYLRSGKT